MPQDIDRHAVQQLQARGAAIVEVLPAADFQQEHIAGAISLPLKELRAETAARALGTDKQRPVVVYCQAVD